MAREGGGGGVVSDRVEVDRADLEAVCNWWRGVGYAECDAAIKRIRKLLEPPGCEARVNYKPFFARCVLPRGHASPHQVDPQLWTEP